VAAVVPAPLNVLAQPNLSACRLAELGVRRISTGSLLFRNALRAAVEAACAVRDGEPVSSEPSYGNLFPLAVAWLAVASGQGHGLAINRLTVRRPRRPAAGIA